MLSVQNLSKPVGRKLDDFCQGQRRELDRLVGFGSGKATEAVVDQRGVVALAPLAISMERKRQKALADSKPTGSGSKLGTGLVLETHLYQLLLKTSSVFQQPASRVYWVSANMDDPMEMMPSILSGARMAMRLTMKPPWLVPSANAFLMPNLSYNREFSMVVPCALFCPANHDIERHLQLLSAAANNRTRALIYLGSGPVLDTCLGISQTY
jgi:hypothetical protein